ncbi:hypothetical protein ACFQY3_25180 [Paenibacillus farraposensis]
MGEPYVEHIEGKIWELRPGNYRFIFLFGEINLFLQMHFVKGKENS